MMGKAPFSGNSPRLIKHGMNA